MNGAPSIDSILTGGVLHSAIVAGLRQYVADVSSSGRRTWRFGLGHALLGEGQARCEPHWLVLDVPLQHVWPLALDPWKTLEFHSAAPAGIKLLAPSECGRPPQLRSELPLDFCDEPQLIGRIGDLCRGLVQAASMFSQTAGMLLENEPEPDPEPCGQIDPAELAALCAGCGWPCEPRRGGTRFIAKLEVSRAAYQAVIEPRADGCIDVRVDLSTDVMQTQVTLHGAPDLPDAIPALEEPSRMALAIALGAVADRVHLVRGAASETSAGLAVQLEAALPRFAVAADVSHALAALSVACEQCGPEAQLFMTDPSIAEAFLALGWSPGPAVTACGESSRLVPG